MTTRRSCGSGGAKDHCGWTLRPGEGGRDGAAEIVSLEYDLGEAAVDGMTFRIRGRLSAAAGECLPLVLVPTATTTARTRTPGFRGLCLPDREYLARRGSGRGQPGHSERVRPGGMTT